MKHEETLGGDGSVHCVDGFTDMYIPQNSSNCNKYKLLYVSYT